MATPPAIDYTDKDYASLRQALFDLAAYRLPEWTDRSPADLGVLLIDMLAYVGDILSYYQDRLASEAYLATAAERRSVQHLLRLVGYELAGPVAAAADLDLVFNPPGAGQPSTVRVPNQARFGVKPEPGAAAGVPPPDFEYLGPDLDIDLDGPKVTARADGKLLLRRVPVRHSRSVNGEVLGSATGEPNQIFGLAAHPVNLDTLVVTVDEGAGPVAWTRRQNLAYHRDDDGRVKVSAADSRDYYVQLDEEGRASVVFGDGTYGRRPPVGAANVRASYSVGGGTEGNVGAGRITLARTAIPNLDSVSNPLPAAGGADAEPVDWARRFGPQAFRSGDRAVTLRDYRALALQFGGVAKVWARSTGWNRVELYVAPDGPELAPSPADLKQRLVRFFEHRRMVGTSVRIFDPTAVPIDVAVELVLEHNHDPGSVVSRVETAVRGLLAFANVEFGQPLYLSKVYEATEAVDGVRGATVTRFRRHDQGPPAPFLRRRGILLEAGLGSVDKFVQRAFAGEIAVEGRLDLRETELATPGTIEVTARVERQ
ncbi:MAG: putative baseplate assembly protein [Acidimicrobiales bacterium]